LRASIFFPPLPTARFRSEDLVGPAIGCSLTFTHAASTMPTKALASGLAASSINLVNRALDRHPRRTCNSGPASDTNQRYRKHIRLAHPGPPGVRASRPSLLDRNAKRPRPAAKPPPRARNEARPAQRTDDMRFKEEQEPIATQADRRFRAPVGQ